MYETKYAHRGIYAHKFRCEHSTWSVIRAKRGIAPSRTEGPGSWLGWPSHGVAAAASRGNANQEILHDVRRLKSSRPGDSIIRWNTIEYKNVKERLINQDPPHSGNGCRECVALRCCAVIHASCNIRRFESTYSRFYSCGCRMLPFSGLSCFAFCKSFWGVLRWYSSRVFPKFSESPHVWSSVPHLKPDFQETKLRPNK